LPDAQTPDKLEMLVDKANRTGRLDRPRVGFDLTERNVCERRLARTVLADKRVNLAFEKLEIDAVNRGNAWIRFAYPAQRKRAR
jgi:hypothetical protein